MNDENLVKLMKRHLQALNDPAGFGANMTVTLTNALTYLAANQRRVSAAVPGCIPGVGETPSKDTLRTYVLAIFVELGEFLQELDWKPWKTKADVDKEKVAAEFADILAFLGVLLVQLQEGLGIDASDLAIAYKNKSVVNVERFLGQHGAAYAQADKISGATQLPLFVFDDENPV